MGMYFVYRDLKNRKTRVYHAKDDADVQRVFGLLDSEPNYENITNFVDEYDATVRFCRADFAYDVVDALNKLMSICEIPAKFSLDIGRSNASGGWMVHIVPPISDCVQTVTYTDFFYNLITAILRDFDQDCSFVGADRNRFVFSEVVK